MFGSQCRVEVVSLGGECKEVIAEWDRTFAHNTLTATAIGVGEYSCASSALVSGVYYGLDLVDLKIPLYSDEDFKKYVSILEEREQSYQNSRKS